MDKMDAVLWKLARLIATVTNEMLDYSKRLAVELNKKDDDYDYTQVDYWTRRKNAAKRELDDLCDLVGLPRILAVIAVNEYRNKNESDEAFVAMRNLIDDALNDKLPKGGHICVD